MQTLEAYFDSVQPEQRREEIREAVASKLVAAGIIARVELVSMGVSGLLRISSNDPIEDLASAVRSCAGISGVQEHDPQAIYSQAVLDEPPLGA